MLSSNREDGICYGIIDSVYNWVLDRIMIYQQLRVAEVSVLDFYRKRVGKVIWNICVKN